jgi:SAM-dependent methyltransferase
MSVGELSTMPGFDRVLLGDVSALDVITDVSPNDAMHRHAKIAHGDDALEMYLLSAAHALRAVLLGSIAAQKSLPRTILDFGAGYGRVLRMFRAAFPEAEVTACDIDRDGVDYCAETFGARPVYATDDPDELEIEGRFDLIWCGSVFTHHSAERWEKLFDLMIERLLTPDGLLVFSSHGRRVQRLLEQEGLDLGLTAKGNKKLLAAYRRKGFAYEAYPVGHEGFSSYGVSLSSPQWVFQRLAQRSVVDHTSFFESICWNQDVFACGRTIEGTLQERHG